MFEDRTYENLLAAGKKQVSDNVLKTEGSLVHNAISAMAYELEKWYIQADWVMRQSDPAQADFANLITLAAARAVYLNEATYAQVKMTANTDVPIGTRFSLSGYNYVVAEELRDDLHSYRMQCEEAGSGPNGLMGALTPIDYVEGLAEAEITALLVAGKDADGRDELYKNYIDSFKESGFGGNIADYRQHMLSFDGIGGAKIYPVWDGPGTVKCVLLGADYGPVSGYLISEIQAAMMAVPEKGYGIAPIGHTVTVESAEGVELTISTNITFRNGYSWATLREKIKEAIAGYLLSTRKEWPSGNTEDYITVYISRIEAAVLDVTGILDVTDTTINDATSNLALTPDQIPILKEVNSV